MQNSTQSVRRALTLLKAFDRATPPLGVTELAARVGLHKSTAYRLAVTLVAEGFLRQDPITGRYSLGDSLYRVAAGFVEQDPLMREGRPVLSRRCATPAATWSRWRCSTRGRRSSCWWWKPRFRSAPRR
ncbi:MAG: helix-turn-helix domain-containing protein [Burkholderiaceae bacterium]|nr:helix-turn-helix domain-containing protein [Burkholderiaceae bacterium]